jgi:hypothetical protein
MLINHLSIVLDAAVNDVNLRHLIFHVHQPEYDKESVSYTFFKLGSRLADWWLYKHLVKYFSIL